MSTPSSTIARRQLRDERGSSTATAVIMFPILLVILMTLVQWGLYFHAQSLADAAAQDAARAAQGIDGTPADGEAVADALLYRARQSGLLQDITVEVTSISGTVRAEVTGQVRSLVPIPGLASRVRGVSQGPAEVFVPEDHR
jgi:Flp pilus assembly protein TadG